eukprot:CAMPEP_0119353378 /NCGR_PEP_ID=MMETSP1334-20130426/2536_1 /TAXON_ID=127549 /ORGANISM="Calcidiscus leptoporus, Strain RCC1130" /LENGTH=301 /DNA_ID=CAMNT_0007366647 /DNA_START=57 /DNA_END=962 /DNA_ORIENTATION=+
MAAAASSEQLPVRLTRRWSAAANGLGPAPPRTYPERLNGPRSASAAERSGNAGGKAAQMAHATAVAADKCCRAGLNIVIDGVIKLIELIGTTGGAFGRLSPHVAQLTAGFLLGAFFLVGSFVLLHRMQTIMLEENARAFELRQLDAQGQQELEITKMMVPFMRLPDGVGSTTAGLHYGNHNFSIEITASDEVVPDAKQDSAPRPVRSTCCPEPVCADGVRVFTEDEIARMRTCVRQELERHFGQFAEDEVAWGADSSGADADGSGAIEGAEVVRAMELSVPEMLLAVDDVRRVILQLSWCM